MLQEEEVSTEKQLEVGFRRKGKREENLVKRKMIIREGTTKQQKS